MKLLSAPERPVRHKFGESILTPEGELDNVKLREIVFSDANSKQRLEEILHPLVFKKINHDLEEISAAYCILSIPLLVETGSSSLVDTVLVVDCPVSLQIDRVCKRDGITPEQVKIIIQSQVSREDRLKAANEVISNDGEIDKLYEDVRNLHLTYSKRALL